jgi:diguanylate cyclase (GGDEF)-like protein/PAS domain S-box-containing protein
MSGTPTSLPEGSVPDAARLLDRSRVATVVVSLDGTISYASDATGQMLGTSADAVVGTSIIDWLSPDELGRAIESLTAIAASPDAHNFPMVFRLRRADGRDIEVDVLANDLVADPAVRGVLLNVIREEDRTRYVDPIRALAAGLDHASVLRLVAAGVGRGGHSPRPAAVVAWADAATGIGNELYPARMDDELLAAIRTLVDGDSDGIVRMRALVPRQRLSLPAASLPPGIAEVLSARDRAGIRVGAIGADGDAVGVLLAAEPTVVWANGEWTPSMVHHWDDLLDLGTVAFERHRWQSRLLHSATHDGLTGLANRAHFHDRLGRLGTRHDLSVLYLDLDDFKEINDRFGHARGDAVLAEIGNRLRDVVRPDDLVARLGGDEFAVAVIDAPAATVVELAQRLLAVVSEPLPLSCGGGSIGVSIGVAHRAAGEPVEAVVIRADHALIGLKRELRKGSVAIAVA